MDTPDISNLGIITQLVTGLIQVGAVGTVCAYFMYRDNKQRDHEDKEGKDREATWEEREARLIVRLEKIDDFCREQLLGLVNDNNLIMREASVAMREFSESVASLECVIERRRSVGDKRQE